MKFTDNFFKKVEKKTNVNKETILSLAERLKDENMKNENVLREVIQQIGTLTGKKVTKEKEDKIVKTIIDDKIPDNITEYVK